MPAVGGTEVLVSPVPRLIHVQPCCPGDPLRSSDQVVTNPVEVGAFKNLANGVSSLAALMKPQIQRHLWANAHGRIIRLG